MLSAELMSSLREIISATRDNAAEAVRQYVLSPDDVSLSADARDNAVGVIETVAMAAENAELPGLHHLSTMLLEHIDLLFPDAQQFSPGYAQSIIDWANRVLVYLRRPQTPDERLLIPLAEEEREGMLELLVAIPKIADSKINLDDTDDSIIEAANLTDNEPADASPERLDYGYLLDDPSTEIDLVEEITSNSEDILELESESYYSVEPDTDIPGEALFQGDDLTPPPLEVTPAAGVELDFSMPDDSAGFGGADDMLGILRQELKSFFSELPPPSEFINTDVDAKSNTESIINYSDVLERLYSATDMLGFSGLAKVFEFVNGNVKALAEIDTDFRSLSKEILEVWPDIVLSYVEAPDDDKKCVALVSLLQNNQWPIPLDDNQTVALIDELISTLDVSEFIEEGEQRKTTAEADDVTLIISDEIDPLLVDAFLQEAPEHAADFSACIGRISSGDDIKGNISAAQRHAHTLKGIASMVGVNGVANLAHHLEDILDYLIKQNAAPPAVLVNILQEAADSIEIMVECLLGKEQPPSDALHVLQDVIDWAINVDAGHLDTPERFPLPIAETSSESAQVRDSTVEQQAIEISENISVVATDMLRVPMHTIDEVFRLVGEMSIALGQIQEQVHGLIRGGKELRRYDGYLQQKRYELQDLVEIRSLSNQHINTRASAVSAEFDSLELDQYDELYSATNMFIEAVADSRAMTSDVQSNLISIDGMLNHQLRMNKELQEYVTTTRMVPVKNLEARLHRNVRQACRATDKKADLFLKGGDLLVDSDVLSRLAEPLMHMLRNAVDHGIEDPAARAANGKKDSGKIELEFSRQGNTLLVKCADDGQGLDYERIYDSSLEKGLYKGNKSFDDIDKSELARLILIPRFSTRSVVTKTSGRGVGMDVVHKAIKDLKGIMDIGDNLPSGCLITLQLPITLITNHSVMVRAGKEIFAFPTNTLDQILAPEMGHFHINGGEEIYEMGEQRYPAYSLSTLLRIPIDTNSRLSDNKAVLLARGDTGMVAISVDQVISSYELVIKGMGRFVRPVQGVSGTAVLRDGSVVTVLDIQELLRIPADAELDSNYDAVQLMDEPELSQVLIVDDSLSVRNSLAQLVSDEGYEPHLARDGMEAMDMLLKHKPDLVLTDLEMPRMNGLELAAQIRASESLSDLPIVMITSRTQQKHREQAEKAGVSLYITKPYAVDDLIEAMHRIINEG